MTPEQITALIATYANLYALALTVGKDLADLIRKHAAERLSLDDLAVLEAKWNADYAEATTNSQPPTA